MLPQKAEVRSPSKFPSQQPPFQPPVSKSNAGAGGTDVVLTCSLSAWREKYPFLKTSSATYCCCNSQQQYEDFSDLTVLWREAKAKFFYDGFNFYSFSSHRDILLSPWETTVSFLVPNTGFN